ncbi:MAG: M13 family metallopeptidase [Planctomycetes bacterium]|nr:M13 family metallopeptidase [Planctomycetota bacterium]
MRKNPLLPLVSTFIISIWGCAAATTHSPRPVAAAGLDLRDINNNADPRADFDEFANGGWKRNNMIPEDLGAWEAFNEVQERNYVILRKVMEDAAADSGAPEGSERRKLGDFWTSGMDTARIDAEGAKPLQDWMSAIANIKTNAELQSVIVQLHKSEIFALFPVFVDQDYKDANRVIINIMQGGLGLPDRDYYTNTDEESKALREEYVHHIAKMFQLVGVNEKTATDYAGKVLMIETRLAEASLTNIELRDPMNIYHLMKITELQELAPAWDWNRYFAGIGVPGLSELNVGMPAFLKRVNAIMEQLPIEGWQIYLKWHVIHDAAPALGAEFVNANFEFYDKTLQGAKVIRPRWKHMLGLTDGALGEALGREYVKIAFTPRAKDRARELVNNLIRTFAERIQSRVWMSEETKKAALEKLHAIKPKIGYPDQFRDYSQLTIKSHATLYENYSAAAAFRFKRNINKFGKPVDRAEWEMLPHEVDAYYNSSKNEIVFPAGILQPPFFDERNDDALNYGAIGSVIGHEMTHGFDDEGSRFDAKGNLRMWWTEKDRTEFERRAALVAGQFDGFTAVEDKKVNGKLTLGENIADLGGLVIAYHAYKKSMNGSKPEPIDGFTAEQRFFISYARGWRALARPESLKRQIQQDVHAPARFRVLGPLQNMTEFAEAFGCKSGDPMFRGTELRAEIW